MVNPIIPVATLLLRLNAARGKASKLNKELVTESMKPRTRKMKEKQLEDTIAKAKEIEKQIPPDTPGFAMGGGVMMPRRRNISGLTNLFSKYNTSGPLAGAGVPRGTMPVGMNQGGNAAARANLTDAQADRLGLFDDSRGDPDFGGRPDFADVPVSVRRQVLSDLRRVPDLPPITQDLPPVASETLPAQTTTPPFTPSSGIVAGGPAPGEVKVVDTGDPYTGQAQLPQPDPLPPLPPPPVVDVVQPPSEQVAPPSVLPPAPDLPPAVYQPPQPTEVSVPTEPMFTPPPVAATPELIDPVMLSGQTVDFGIADQITPQIGGYATTQGMDIAATSDPFADAVEGQYQMPIYRPQAAGAMPFLSLDFARPSTPSDAPPPPQSENYSTGSYGRLEFAEAIANYERMYGPVEDYQAPDTDAVMTDDTTQSTDTGTGASTVTSGTRFYPEPPPVRGSGGIGPATLYRRQLEAWEAQYGPVEDYYAAQNAAQQNAMNIYLSQQGEEAIAAQYGYTVEELRDVNARRREQGLPPLGELVSGINVGM
jgi:hypothetical protein